MRFPERKMKRSIESSDGGAMENMNENASQPGRVLGPPQHVPMGMPRKDYFAEDARYKSRLLATLMSLVPGLGQIYVGYYQQGFINIIVIAGLISLLASEALGNSFTPFLAFFMVFYWLFNMVDAYRKAVFYNQALEGLGPLDLPEGEQFSGLRGSLLGGVVLIIVGAIALGYTRFGLPLAWIQHWWPAALILMGVYLLYQALANRKKQLK